MSKRMLVLLRLSACLLAFIALTGSPTGFASVANAPDPTATSPESCSVCHKNAGTDHQQSYDELYQDAVVQVSNVAFTYLANEKQSVVSFKMTKNGAAFDAKNADSLNIYFAPYTGKSFEGAARQSLKGTVTCDGAGNCKSTLANGPDVSHTAGLIAVYGMDEQVGTLPARISQAKYTFSAMAETGGGVDYVSAANNAGCEKCHSDPFLKHGYIAAQVNNDPSTDFYTCKTCHLETRPGTGLYTQQRPVAAEYAGY